MAYVHSRILFFRNISLLQYDPSGNVGGFFNLILHCEPPCLCVSVLKMASKMYYKDTCEPVLRNGMDEELENIKLTVAYVGTHFLGWQKTKEGRSVEQTLEHALHTFLREKVFLQAASRTDRNVHAKAQVVQFFTRKKLCVKRAQRSLNGLLPSDIRILDIEKMAWSFHPTLDAIGKEYSYEISLGPIQLPWHRETAWHIPFPFEVARMEQAFPFFIGKKDFSSFCNHRKNLCYPHKEREIFSIEMVTLPDNRIAIKIRGNHFLYKMARNIVGTVVYVGLGKIEKEAIVDIFKKNSRIYAPVTAPAHGLTLTKIIYPC